ncbi:MAG: UDP-N-acetylmuramoyl-L-alanyl-D-glutamate--2,6-diaminopimelate ligase [Planctomycetota bacterium]|jgi:UDP-N-acetylmuramoyl-L-alanyl-D-glutamate--2,6-diaminopimelate ligase
MEATERLEQNSTPSLTRLIERFGGHLVGRADSVSIGDVRLDSRAVQGGDLFAALPGAVVDGVRFAPDAADRGAAALLTPSGRGLRAAYLTRGRLPVWEHDEPRRVAGLVAGDLLGNPTQHLRVCGITGTNGKTTTAHLCGQLLENASLEPAIFGTAGHRLAGGERLDASHTTPGAPTLQRLCARHLARGGRSVVMEVSSHGLMQERTAGVDFDVAVFTNLTREHLDYHGDMQAYGSAKARLFAELQAGRTAVLNRDDPFWLELARVCDQAGARVVTYSVTDTTRSQGELVASRLRIDPEGSRFVLNGMGIEPTEIRLPLLGRYNVENALAATAAALLLGASPAHALSGLATISPAPGRLEPIDVGGRGFQLYIDYAHSPDALDRVMRALRANLESQPGNAAHARRLIVVYGCGGDRDVGKRPAMGRVVAGLADIAILTTDNPRSEDPSMIASEVIEGLGKTDTRPELVLDRRAAIARAVEVARDGDIILVAGKGHECVQVVGDDVRSFDDRAVAMEVLS